MNRTWWKEAVVYQIYPRSFQDSNGDGIGDLNGIWQRLSHLKYLGVDVIWICPMYSSPNADNGYDISDYKDIMKDFGTMADFDRLLAEAHALGMKLIIDLVANHTSDEHQWFIESRKSKDNQYRDYYYWRDPRDDGGPPNNWGGAFGDSAWKWDEQTQQYYLHLFLEKQPDLNWENHVVRSEVYEIMRWWLNKGIDGFRMDVINYIGKDQRLPDGPTNQDNRFGQGVYGDFEPYASNLPSTHAFIREMNREVLSHYDIMTVGEASNANIEDAVKYAGFDSGELNMIFSFEHMELDHGEYGKWSTRKTKLTDFKKALTKWQKELHDRAWNSLVLNNHDHARMVSRFGDDRTEENRTLSAKMLATCIYLLQGAPYLYQGEEIGMTNAYFNSLADYRDVETLNAYDMIVNKGNGTKEVMLECMKRISRDNARTPVQWDASPNAGFTPGVPWIRVNENYHQVNVLNQMEDPDSILHYYKRLLELRKSYDVLIYGEYIEHDLAHPDLFIYKRMLDQTEAWICCNFKGYDVNYTLPFSITDMKLVLSNCNKTDVDENFGPYEARVYIKE